MLSPLDRRSETYRHLAAEAAGKQTLKDRANARQPVMTLPNILTFLRLVRQTAPKLPLRAMSGLCAGSYPCLYLFEIEVNGLCNRQGLLNMKVVKFLAH